MARLTKKQSKLHEQACDILKKDVLSFEDKLFVMENWQESATNDNSAAGAFFTPYDLARDFSLDVGGNRIIDLCAGIGALSLAVHMNNPSAQITCVELNYSYLEVGKKILPEANWIHGSVFDVLQRDLGVFDWAISNPPFGNVKTRDGDSPRYKGSNFEFHVIDIASHIAECGTFLVPQGSAGFNFSGNRHYERQESGKAFDFQKKTGLYFSAGVGVDTSVYLKDWKGVSPLCEIVCVDFTERSENYE